MGSRVSKKYQIKKDIDEDLNKFKVAYDKICDKGQIKQLIKDQQKIAEKIKYQTNVTHQSDSINLRQEQRV